MQFKALLSIVALAATASAAALEKRAASLVWFSGDDCTGTAIATDSNARLDECLVTALINGGSARSISFSNVPNRILFFVVPSTTHVPCNAGYKLNATGSGCATAPAG